MVQKSRIESFPPAILPASAALGYAGILTLGHLVPNIAHITRVLLPNLWLIATAVLWYRRFDADISVFRGGKRPWLSITVAAFGMGLNVVMMLLWPHRPTHAVAPYDIAIVLFIPTAEELFFRGMLLDYLTARTRRRTVAIALTALTFGAAHVPQGEVIAATMTLLGVGLAGLAAATGSLIGPLVLHLSWNSLSTLRELGAGADRIVIVVISIAAVLGLTVFGMMTRENKAQGA